MRLRRGVAGLVIGIGFWGIFWVWFGGRGEADPDPLCDLI